MSGLRLFSNVIIALLAVWVSYAYVNSIIGNTIMFPLVSPSEENIPYYKLQTVRLSVFITFVYYALFHVIKGSEKIYPIHFLKTYLFALAFNLMLLILIADVFMVVSVLITLYTGYLYTINTFKN